MTSPLYSVGQDVAVCTDKLELVIPSTTVLAVEYEPPGIYRDGGTGNLGVFDGGYTYLVSGTPLSVRGNPLWLQERHLRPINPDTEYLSDSAPQKLETTL